MITPCLYHNTAIESRYGLIMYSTLLMVFLLFAPSAFSSELPEGWRYSTEKELSDEPLRKQSPTKNAKVEGDFNGDGKIDYALLLKSTTFSGEGLAIKLSTTGGYSWQIIDEIKWGEDYYNVSLAMGINLATPGNYKTACGKGYWDCKKGEIEILELKLPGIWHYKFESAASVWFWDISTKTFKRIWISD